MGDSRRTVTNKIIADISAYCACKICCGPNAKGICANNKPPREGITIAASRKYPLNKTTVIIQGKAFKVEDRLAPRYDNRFDIYFASHQKAKEFGIKHKQQVTIITP